jgi:hypothetical protein
LVTAAAGGSSTFALPGVAMYPSVPTYPSTFDFGQFSAFGGADNATVTFSASPEFASTSYSVKYDVGGTRPENDLSDKVVVTKTMKLKPAATRAAAEATTRAGEPLPYEFVDNYTITVPAVADAPKRTYIDAWVYITSFDGPGGTDSIRVRRYAGGDASKILYLDAQGKLQAGPNGTVTAANVMHFKFGSIVGMGGGVENDPYDTSDVKFNPSAVIPTANWATVPLYEPTDWPAITNISSPEYNTFENLKKGKGDPCMLIGYDVTTIKSWDETAFNAAMAAAQYRLPTVFDNIGLTGGPAAPIANATIPYWKDWTLTDLIYAFTASADSSPYEYTYPTGTSSTLKYTYFTAGTPGVTKLPLVVQGKVAAGAYTLPSFGRRIISETEGVGYVYQANVQSNMLSSTAYSATSYRYLFSYPNYINPVRGSSMGNTSTARCVAK